MIDTVVMTEDMWRAARGQSDADIEHASFFLARQEGCELRCHAMRMVESSGFNLQSSVHLELTDEFASQLIRWASDQDSCLLELHSHVGPGRLCLSRTDIDGLRDWVPHVRFRLAGSPYAALVQSRSELDGLVWADDGGPTPLRVVKVGCKTSIATTGHSYERWYQ